jgi:hypothetical protein
MNKLSKLFLIIFAVLPSFASGQKGAIEQSYNLDFLKAKYTASENSNEIVLIFKYEPKPKKIYKPIISMKITYSIGASETETTEILNESKHSVVIYGNDINQKNPTLYSLIKEKIDLNQKQDFGIFVFHLRDISKEYVDKMKFTYGLWEPKKERIRIEKQYEISIDQ